MKRVRMLLRVSSDQQLEADGDLTIQRQIVLDYVNKHDDWHLDCKEYFEGSKSAYKNTSSEREVLQEVLQDAQAQEFDILVLYKDDRVGRLMWDTPVYIMNLKKCGVDVYSVKDGCISPESDDIMGQMMLTFRYANAQKSSADTGMRVKDTAQKLVQNGKFMGGKAPYGYTLEYSGEISKHGRALKHLVVIPEQAEIVQYIYDLALNKEYGSSKIARELNLHKKYKDMAPNDNWKGGTIASILTNPIYTGRTAYKRRERIAGKYKRLDREEWIVSTQTDPMIAIIDDDIWNRTQESRRLRGDKYTKKLENQNVTIMKRNDGCLPLIDVIYCGYCGSKLTNGSKYSYWTIKDTGERRAHKIPAYKCQSAWSGIPHDKNKQFRADKIEEVIFEALSDYIGKIQENENVFDEIEKNRNHEKLLKEKELKKELIEIEKSKQKIEVMKSHIPEAMTGEYPLSLEELVSLIRQQEKVVDEKKDIFKEKEAALKCDNVTLQEWEEVRKNIPTWQEVFLSSDSATKRVLVNRLIERIEVKKDEIVVRFKINLNDFIKQEQSSQHRMNGDSGVPE